MKKIFCFSLFSVIWYVHGALPPPSLQGYMTPKEKTEKAWELVLSGEQKVSALVYVDAGGAALCQVDLSQVLLERRSQFVPSFMEPVSTQEESQTSVFPDLPVCEGEELQDITLSAKHFTPPSGIRQAAAWFIPPHWALYALTAVLGCFLGQATADIAGAYPGITDTKTLAVKYGFASVPVGVGGLSSWLLGETMPRTPSYTAAITTNPGVYKKVGGGKALGVFAAGAIGCETVKQGFVYFFTTDPKAH